MPVPPERVNADFMVRVVIATDALAWLPSPQAGVERRLLDRVGGEVARATSLVRYASMSTFPAHGHELGEEFLVLDGVFSDEHGDYPKGTYVRNPPGSSHTPRTEPGCTIFVKLRQMDGLDIQRVVIDTGAATWRPSDIHGVARVGLFSQPGGETVALERLAPGARLGPYDVPAGEEIFVLDGELADEYGSYAAGTWMRNPVGFRHELRSPGGATYWVKRGHLRSAT
jgi:anti-sigma factor ChrR (cupin superfamily)